MKKVKKILNAIDKGITKIIKSYVGLFLLFALFTFTGTMTIINPINTPPWYSGIVFVLLGIGYLFDMLSKWLKSTDKKNKED